jgi:hypothetical protein
VRDIRRVRGGSRRGAKGGPVGSEAVPGFHERAAGAPGCTTHAVLLERVTGTGMVWVLCAVRWGASSATADCPCYRPTSAPVPLLCYQSTGPPPSPPPGRLTLQRERRGLEHGALRGACPCRHHTQVPAGLILLLQHTLRTPRGSRQRLATHGVGCRVGRGRGGGG